MTVEDAKKLIKGDYVLYNGDRYKVLHIKEHRSASTNEIFIGIKCRRQNHLCWITNEFAEIVT